MKRLVISNTGTDAILLANRILFTVKSSDFKGGTKPALIIDGLAAAETVTLTKNGQIVRNGIITFDSSEGAVALESAGEYGFHKDATASTLNIYVENSI